MAVLRCHQDFLVAQDDAGLLRAYVTKYVYKFSDAAQNEWLNDDASATNMAATVLMRYKPYEPEVVLQMTSSRFRQWDMSTVSRGKRAFVVQLPDCEERPKELSMYMEAAWARGRIPLIDYLRKTTAKGKICNWLKKAHAASDSALPLETFAANYAMQGEKVVAAEMLSRLNDRYYGQWMLLWVPFSDPSELWDEALLARVPAYHRYFAMCWTSRSRVAAQMWHSPANIASDMRLEAHTQHHIDTVSNLVAANGALVDDYLAGRLDAAEEERRRLEPWTPWSAPSAARTRSTIGTTRSRSTWTSSAPRSTGRWTCSSTMTSASRTTRGASAPKRGASWRCSARPAQARALWLSTWSSMRWSRAGACSWRCPRLSSRRGCASASATAWRSIPARPRSGSWTRRAAAACPCCPCTP